MNPNPASQPLDTTSESQPQVEEKKEDDDLINGVVSASSCLAETLEVCRKRYMEECQAAAPGLNQDQLRRVMSATERYLSAVEVHRKRYLDVFDATAAALKSSQTAKRRKIADVVPDQ